MLEDELQAQKDGLKNNRYFHCANDQTLPAIVS